MITIEQTVGRRLHVTVLLAAVSVARTAWAQRDLLGDVVDPLALPAPAVVTDAQLDEWAFGPEGADGARRRFERALTARVSEINRICPLTLEQKKKLFLAGRGDIHHFFADVAKTQKLIRDHQFDDFRVALLSQSRPILAIGKSFFGPQSLFGKSLKNTLGNEQHARYERALRDQHAARHQATLRWVVGILDTTLNLSALQHRRIAALLERETRPPRTFGEYDYYGVLLQISRLPDAPVKAILDAGQWAKLQEHMNEANRLKKTLEERGFVPEEGVASHERAAQTNGDIIPPESDRG